jgi:hypothetical protein
MRYDDFDRKGLAEKNEKYSGSRLPVPEIMAWDESWHDK